MSKKLIHFLVNKCIAIIKMEHTVFHFYNSDRLMELLSVFTGDSSYEKVIPEILERKKKGEVITMCTVAQGLMEKGRAEQFKKDVINSINMLKELSVDEDRIIELIIENHGLTKTEVKEFCA